MEDAEKSDFSIAESVVCSCEHCTEYIGQYKKILQGSPRWLTISPPHADDIELSHEMWMKEFEDLRKFSNNVIGVAEIGENLRLHYHIMYNRTDKIKEYKTINSWRKTSMIKVYNGRPKGGLHYMMKEHEEAQDYVDDPVFTIAVLQARVDRRKKARADARLELKRQDAMDFHKDIPKWMLPEDSE